MYLKQIKNLQLLYISCERFSGYSLASFLLEVSRALESSSFDFELLPMTRPAMPPMTIVPVKLPVGTCKISFTPLKSKITLENHSCLIGYIYIFKWWSFPCHINFRRGISCQRCSTSHFFLWFDSIHSTSCDQKPLSPTKPGTSHCTGSKCHAFACTPVNHLRLVTAPVRAVRSHCGGVNSCSF